MSNEFWSPSGVALVALGYHYAGWPGVALSAGALVMWVLLHFTRLIRVLQRAGRRPIGYLDSAVMLNAKLKRGMTLMHVIAMTRSLGQLQSEKDAQPEVFRWTDPSDSWVECVFDGGRLVRHEMYRPPAPPSRLSLLPRARARRRPKMRLGGLCLTDLPTPSPIVEKDFAHGPHSCFHG